MLCQLEELQFDLYRMIKVHVGRKRISYLNCFAHKLKLASK